MRIAWCLYGQPRLFNEGFVNIDEFIKKNPQHEFHFFLHAWNYEGISKYYCHSEYRKIKLKNLIIHDKSDEKMIKLFNPKKILYERPKNFDKKMKIIENSIMINNLPDDQKNNIKNTLSNIYSKYKSSKLLYEYQNENKINYDLVISTRYDYMNKFIIDLDKIDKTKIYIIDNNLSRLSINDNFIITNEKLFKEYCSAYKNLEYIVNNKHIETISKQLSNEFAFIPENILLSNLIYFYREDIINIFHKSKDMYNFY